VAQKTLLQLLTKYTPPPEFEEILREGSVISSRVDKERRMLEVRASFPSVIKKQRLYALEAQVAQVYDLRSFRILPSYPAEGFTYEYVPEILTEAELVGVVARGFFSDYTYELFDGELTITIPFSPSGVMLLDDARTPRVIENIIMSEFGITVSVHLCHSDRVNTESEEARRSRLEELDRQIAAAERQYDTHARQYEAERRSAPAEETEPALPRLASVYEYDLPSGIDDPKDYRIGCRSFDLSAPSYLVGEPFTIAPVPIATVSRAVKNICFVGDVFSYTSEANRQGDKFNISIGLFDGNSSIYCKRYGVSPEEAKEIGSQIKVGACLAVHGYTKNERNDNELYLQFTEIAAISSNMRKDDAPVKRVELHLHTNMSNMDALIPSDVAVKTAQKWGHPAVAITDHGNVQGFPEAMLASDKTGMKVIYGMEAYFVNDTATAVNGTYGGGFDDEFVVFDLETTGLSPTTCKITEIGAVLIRKGEVLERYNTFVNPEMPIPETITRLTSITDEMVADARTIDEVLPEFLQFVDGRMLIAHNADFDTGFLRAAANSLGIPFDLPYLDTVALSRYLNPDLKSHKLNLLAEHYGLGDFHHHRACDDAEMLAMIFFKMEEQMKELEIKDFAELANDMSNKADPLKLRPYHQIILVKNQTGMKNLYRLISDSYLKYYRRNPRIPKTELEKYREGLIIGSACEAGELFTAILEDRPAAEIEEIVSFYDYLEIQPICNNRFLLDEGRVADEEGLRELNRRIVALGETYNKPVCATCDAHFLNPEDEIYRKILLAGMKFKDADRDVGLFFRTTEEMLEEFSYLGKDKAYEVVVTNTNRINDMIEECRPIPKGSFTPNMEGAEEDLQRLCWENAKRLYGDPVPELVRKRLDKELTSIIKNGFAVLYMIAQKLVWYSESQGYLVGSRGSVGSSLVASMSGISEVNPLPPHYYCPKCQYSEFITDGSVGSGFDLDDKDCPVCGTRMNADGHDIPFETFLGFFGDKSPDIDLNFSGDVQGRVHKYTEELFGSENVFRAGTLGTLADKTAFGFVAKYFETKGVSIGKAEMERIIQCCVGVKRTTGQHPGGIIVVPREYDVYDFTPVQHPADDPHSDIVTTHFAFSYLHDTILKLDELGHDIPTKYKYLEKFSNTSVMDVKMNDKSVYELFLSTKSLGVTPEDIDTEIGTYGLPEFGTRFIQQVLMDAKPKNFADLLQISGLTHGTDVWLGNAQDLIKAGICDISKVIGTRDGIMLDLIRYGMENAMAFKIMESVRKGKGLTPEWEAEMRAHNVPDWYIGSCKKIKYMFPKAHAAAYVMSAIRLGWYKIHIPIAFYCAMFTVAPGGFDAEIVGRGRSGVMATIKDIERRGKEASPKEIASIPTLQLANECMARKIRFLPVDIEKSHSFHFLPENGGIRMPFSSLPGLGENAAQNIIAAREEEPFFSIEDLQTRAKLTKSVIEILKKNHVLDTLNETDQLTFF